MNLNYLKNGIKIFYIIDYNRASKITPPPTPAFIRSEVMGRGLSHYKNEKSKYESLAKSYGAKSNELGPASKKKNFLHRVLAHHSQI